MRVRVIKPFLDRLSGNLRQTGTEYEAAPERVRQINASTLGPFVEPVEAEKPEPAKRAAKKGK